MHKDFRLSSKTILMLGSSLLLLTGTGCQLAENYTKADRASNMEIQDYRDALAPRELPTKAVVNKDPSIPQLQSYIAGAPKASSKPMPMVSIAINQSIPLRDALFELAKQADYDLQLDPRIQGSIIYTARNRPFDEVIDQISSIAGLRTSFENNSVKIEIDNPYTQTYRMDFLPFTRSSTSGINTSVSVGGSGDGAASSNSGSNFSIESQMASDFWRDLEANLTAIVSANQSSGIMRTASDPALSLSNSGSSAASAPPLPPIDPSALAPEAGEENSISFKNVFTGGQAVTSSGSSAGAPSSATAGVGDAQAATGGNTSEASAPVPSTPAAADAVLQVESLPTSSSAGAGGAGGAEGSENIPATFSINRSAGIVTVFAPQSVQRRVAEYLSQVKRAVSQQVLIEAKVLEVQLSDQYENGIDWQVLSNSLGGLDRIGFLQTAGDSLAGGIGATDARLLNTNSFGLRFNTSQADLFLNMLAQFGTVKALASPRITVMNNQSAVLNVAENFVYFNLDIETEEGTADDPGTRVTVSSEQRTVPEGVLINVLPSIDSQNQMVTMQVRPTISRIESFVNDPAVPITLAQAGISNPSIVSQIPVVSVKELDTVVQMNSGEAIVMGGLMEDTSRGNQRAVPVAGEVPILGNLFKTNDNTVQKSEFVIFMKATVLENPADSIHNTDKDLYRTFGQDRRPLKM